MGVVYRCGLKVGRGFGVELSVPETSFQKLGPMSVGIFSAPTI